MAVAKRRKIECEKEISFCVFDEGEAEIIQVAPTTTNVEEERGGEDDIDDVVFNYNVDNTLSGGEEELDDEITFNLHTGNDSSVFPGLTEGPMYYLGSEIDSRQLVIDTCLGTGSTSRVYSGTYKGCPVAIKVFNLKTELKVIEKEIMILQHTSHPNIVRYIGCVGLSPECREKQIIMEFYAMGSLFDLLHGEKRTRASSTQGQDGILPYRYTLALGIAKGMAYLQDIVGVIHCDLSSKNILLSDEWEPKIADFGLAKYGSELNGPIGFGTDSWRAPEIITLSRKRSGNYTNKIDVYSYSIILWELCHIGHIPFEGLLDVEKKVVKAGKRPKISDDCPSSWKRLMEVCWTENPEERPTFAEIVYSLENDEGFRELYVDN